MFQEQEIIGLMDSTNMEIDIEIILYKILKMQCNSVILYNHSFYFILLEVVQAQD